MSVEALTVTRPLALRSPALRHWLSVMIGLIVAMIVVGGATRLTNSGLSITEWAPIRGALPPLSEAKWLSEFEKYKAIPEFTAEHPDMNMAGFKFIYFWEWGHRQLGRLIGLAYALPFFWFLLRGKLPWGRIWAYTAVLVLIGLQGAIGWWMVSSGLVNDRVDVSQYRLATHLGMAFVILGLLLTLRLPARESSSGLAWPARAVAGLVFVQIVAGAFVAGTHSGKTYNSWPDMDGRIVPDGYAMMEPVWRNAFENPAAIQFNHRMLAYIVLFAVLGLWWVARRDNAMRVPVTALAGLTIWQVVLGIATLLAVAPLGLSLLHQFSSILLFGAAMWTAVMAGQSSRGARTLPMYVVTQYRAAE